MSDNLLARNSEAFHHIGILGWQFRNWLKAMREAGLATSDAECGRLLGKSADTIVRMKQNGADRTTALACRALLHRLEPYG